MYRAWHRAGLGRNSGACAAQHLRDARILTIYEGTTGIQANDLIGRKLQHDNGATMLALIGDIRAVAEQLGTTAELGQELRRPLDNAAQALADTTDWLLKATAEEPQAALAGAYNYLMLTGHVCGGWQAARAALIAQQKLAAGDNSSFYQAKLLSARFYLRQLLPQAQGLAEAVRASAAPVLEMPEEAF